MMPVTTVVTCGRAVLRMDPRRPGRQQPVAPHREEDARLAVLEDQQDGAQRDDRAERDDPAGGREAGDFQGAGQRVGGLELLVRDEAGRDQADDRRRSACRCASPAEDAARHVALRDRASPRRRSRWRRSRCRRRRRSPRPGGCRASRSARTAGSWRCRCACRPARRTAPSTSSFTTTITLLARTLSRTPM